MCFDDLSFPLQAVFGLAVNLSKAFSYSVAHRLSGQMWHHHFNHSLEGMNGKDSGQFCRNQCLAIVANFHDWPTHIDWWRYDIHSHWIVML